MSSERVVPSALFSFATPALVGVLTMMVLGPTIFSEGFRDWTTYQAAADRLRAGEPLYVVGGNLLYIYPPPLAAVWAVGLGPEALLVGKIAALGALVWVLGWQLGVPAVVLILLTPSLQHDLVLGNVMVFFAVALTWSAMRPGVPGSIALGLVLGFAAKPVLGPYLLWLLLVRRTDFAWTLATALAVSIVFGLLLGPQRYFEYLAALPAAGQFAASWSGNLGLSSISPILGTVGVLMAYGLALVAARWRESGLPLVIAALLLAQPSYGVAYGLLLIPALTYFWRSNRVVAVLLATALPLTLGLSYAPVASLLTAGAAVYERYRRRSDGDLPLGPRRLEPTASRG